MPAIPPMFLDTVVAIGKDNPGGPKDWIGTGMALNRFVDVDMESELPGARVQRHLSVLASCRHVLDGSGDYCVRMNNHVEGCVYESRLSRIDPDLEYIGPTLAEAKSPDLGVATFPIFGNPGTGGFKGTTPSGYADIETLSQAGVGEGDSVVLLGFPMGDVGEMSNAPTVRAGVIARIQPCLRNESPSFLIDIPVYPGNSGGPVALWPVPEKLAGGSEYDHPLIIGMVYESRPYRERVFSEQTGDMLMMKVENTGLTRVIPMDPIEELIQVHAERQWNARKTR